MKKSRYKATIAFVVALALLLSGAAMGVNSDFSEKENISSSDVDNTIDIDSNILDEDNTIIIDSDSMDLQTLDGGTIESTGIDDWPMFHHDLENTGYSTSTAPDTKNILWTYTTGGIINRASPVVADDKVYIGSNDNNLYCLDAIDGSFIWNYTTGDSIEASSPAVAYGKVYVGSNDNNLYCLDALNGSLIWSCATGDKIQHAPKVADEKVYFGSFDHNMYCLDAIDGSYIWSYLTGDKVYSSPAVVDGNVFFGSSDCNLYCLDALDGSLIWSYDTGNSIAYASPVVVDGKVFIAGSQMQTVYCVNETDGSLIWSYYIGNVIMSTPAVAYGKVYVGSNDNNLYCLDALNGSFIWSYYCDHDIYSSPAVADGKVYFGSNDKNIYCLDATDGSLMWSHSTSCSVLSSPAIANGRVYIGSDNLYCFAPPEHDVGVTSIDSPVSGIATTFTPEVTVENFGVNNEIDVPVNMQMGKNIPGPTWTEVVYGGTGQWEQKDYASGGYFLPPGTGTYFAQASASVDVLDVGLFTPSLDLTGLSSVTLEFETSFCLYYGDWAEVNTYSGDVLEENLVTYMGYYNYGTHVVLTFDPSGYTDPSDVTIEFYYTSAGTAGYIMVFAIDDVSIAAACLSEGFEGDTFPPVEQAFILEYDETVTTNIDIGESKSVTFPDWTPIGSSGPIDYVVISCTQLTTDQIPGNDCQSEAITLDHRTVVSIQPSSQMVGKGDTFTVSVFVEQTEPIIGVRINFLYFNASLIQANSVTEADLFDEYLMFNDGDIDNVNGKITDVYILAEVKDNVSDPGNFVNITFTALNTFGTSALDLEGIIVTNVPGAQLPLAVIDGEVIITEMFNLTINVVGEGTTDPSEGIHTFPYGEVVDLEAFPGTCWNFSDWSGDITTTDNPTNITMDGNKSVTVTFNEIFYDLTIDVVGSGTTTPAEGVHSIACSTVVPVEAIADPGWNFSDWSGDLVSSNPSDSILMDGDKTITATFTQIFHDLTILLDGSGTTTPAAGIHSYAWGTDVPVSAVGTPPDWVFTEWLGDVAEPSSDITTILMDDDKTITAIFKMGWKTRLDIVAQISSNNTDWVVFGESAIASDGIDPLLDIPKPEAPPAPYLYAYLVNTELDDPHKILWEEIRYYTADEQIWDLWIETQGTGQYTTTTMTWDPITSSGYDYVGLYEMISGNCVADMTIDVEYVYLSDHTTPQYFQIRCTNNHAPVANDDFYTTNENTELTVTSPGVLLNDDDQDGDDIEVDTLFIPVASHGTVDIFEDGHFVYTPDVGHIGLDSFVYQITDGLLTDTATVTIDVIPLNRISIKERWNLISMPVGEDIDRNDIIVEYNLVRYSWQEAIDDDLILGDFTYGWQVGMYNNDELLVPGEGYWLWSYVDCDLLIPSSVPGDNHVTYLDVEWNLVGVPYGTDVSKTSLRVQFEAIWRYWDTAVNMGVILDFVYDWDRDNQFYTISDDDPDTFVSGFGYWVYAYEGCALKKV